MGNCLYISKVLANIVRKGSPAYMKRTYLYRLILLLACVYEPIWGQILYAERIFLTTDKENCMPGDTLLANGQVISSNKRTFYPDSRYVYIECIDNRDSLLLRQKVACDEKGYFRTDIPTQFEWGSNLCYLRAYTRLMQNYEPESFTIVPFLLGAIHPQKEEIAREVHALCFPEGGSLVEGFQQNMVFQFMDDDGFPIVPSQTRLLDANNDTIIHQISVSENGLGRLSFLPEAGTHYRLQAEYDGRFFNFPLKTTPSGTALQAILNRNRLTCRIFSSEEKVLHLFLYYAESGLTEIPLQAGQQAVVLNLSEHPKGIYTLFLTDAEYHLLNERILWLPQTEQPDLTCQLPQTVFTPAAPLNYRLQAPDSSRVFVRIVPRHNLIATQAYPALLFGNEILSPVRFPLMDSREWKDRMTEINNWLFTARFALFPIEKLLKEGIQYAYPTEDVMLLSGTAWKNENRPLEAGVILSARNLKDQLFYSGTIEEKGQFILPVDNYSNGTKFLLSAQDLKGKPIDCTFTLKEEAYPNIHIPYPVFRQTQWQTAISSDGPPLHYSVDENQNKVYHIDNLTVQAHKPVDIRKISRTPLNYIGEIELQQRGGLSLRSVLSRFPNIVVRMSVDGGGSGELGALNKAARFSNQDRDRSSQELSQDSGELAIYWRNSRNAGLSGAGGNPKLTVVVDNEIAFGDIGHILDQPAGSLKSIEILKPSDTRCVRYNATLGGVLLIETVRGLEPLSPEQSNATVRPPGLSASSHEPIIQPHAPNLPGHYLLLVDVITKEKQIVSFCRPFEVK